MILWFHTWDSQGKINRNIQSDKEQVEFTERKWWGNSAKVPSTEETQFKKKAFDFSTWSLTLGGLVYMYQNSDLMDKSHFMYCNLVDKSHHVTLLFDLNSCLGGYSFHQLPRYIWFNFLPKSSALTERFQCWTGSSCSTVAVSFQSLCPGKNYSHW